MRVCPDLRYLNLKQLVLVKEKERWPRRRVIVGIPWGRIPNAWVTQDTGIALKCPPHSWYTYVLSATSGHVLVLSFEMYLYSLTWPQNQIIIWLSPYPQKTRQPKHLFFVKLSSKISDVIPSKGFPSIPTSPFQRHFQNMYILQSISMCLHLVIFHNY